MATKPKDLNVRHLFSPDFKVAAVARVAAGETVAAVAADLCVDAPTLYGWVSGRIPERRTPYRRAGGSKRGSRYGAAKRRRVLAELEAGTSWADLVRRHRINQSTIYRWAVAAGVRQPKADRPVIRDADASRRALRRDWWWRLWGGKIRGGDARKALRLFGSGSTIPEVAVACGWPGWVAGNFRSKALSLGKLRRSLKEGR